MKTGILILGVVVVVIGVLILYKNNKKEMHSDEAVVSNTSELDNSEEKMSPVMNGSFVIRPADSKVLWTGKKTIKKDWIDTGTIAVKEGNVEIKNGMIASGKIVFDMASIDTDTTGGGGGQEKLTGHLKSDSFFDVAKYPVSTFVVTSSNAESVTGDLTIKGVTKSTTIPISISVMGDNIYIKGKATVDRTLFGVKYGSNKFFDDLKDNIIDDIFTLDFDIVAQ